MWACDDEGRRQEEDDDDDENEGHEDEGNGKRTERGNAVINMGEYRRGGTQGKKPGNNIAMLTQWQILRNEKRGRGKRRRRRSRSHDLNEGRTREAKGEEVNKWQHGGKSSKNVRENVRESQTEGRERHLGVA